MRLVIENTNDGTEQEFILSNNGDYDEHALVNWYNFEVDEMYISYDDILNVILT